MKLVTALTIGLMSSTVFAATGSGFERLQENRKTSTTLDHCKGTAELDQAYVNGQRLPLLKFRDVTNCSIITIDGIQLKQKIERVGRFGQADVLIEEVPGKNVHVVTLESGSGQTSDTVEVVSYGSQPQQSANISIQFSGWSTLLGGEVTKRLYDCGGEVTARLQDGETLTLIFRDVESCSKFDILSADGDSVNYPTKSLQAKRDGNFAGSFTIPKRFIDAGKNAIKVVLKSNTGKHDEVISVKFTAL